MDNAQTTSPADEDKKDHPLKKVEVTVDTKHREVRPGEWVVADFKNEVKVDASRILEQVVNGQLVILQDTQTIEIKGGEVFVSHVPQGGSS